jgi:hypothetical protein
MLDGWAYRRMYGSSRERRAALPGWTSTITAAHTAPSAAIRRHEDVLALAGACAQAVDSEGSPVDDFPSAATTATAG